MMNQNSENWLPPGWTVKVKVRKSGKKDKYYFEPSSQMRFNSRAEVFRYLKTAAISHPESEESRTVEQPENNVEVKKTIAKGLPPGWIREIRVTRTANRIRRDSFYINPVNGNALRSLRDVHRYLTSGKVSRLAYKSRSQSNSNSNIEFQHDDISSPAVSKKEMLAIGKAKRQIIWSDNSPEPSEIADDEAIFPKAASVGERMAFLKPNLTHGRIGAKLHCTTPEEAKGREQSEGKNNFSEFVSTPDKSIQHKCTSENGATKIESRKRQRKSKDINLRCRASKRLAGLQAEPVLEAKTDRRACSVACEESDKQVASTTKWPSQCPEKPDVKHETKSIIDSPKIDTNLDSSRKEHSAVDLSILPQKVKKMKSEDAYEQQQQPKCNSFLPSEDVLEKHVGQVESDDKADVKKQGPLLKLPMEDLLTDPCIAFAVKTLTGDVFDASISSEASLMPNNIDRPFVAFTPNERRNLESENKLNEKLPSPELPVTRVGKVENNNIVEKLDSTLKLPVGEIWADPCIEFAIKTLTGEIPLVNNPDIEDYFHQFAPSKTEGTNANASNHVGSY
ncbi:methyl-CpG-binding domain-containing protein 13-like isoform X2 [Cucurbita pepo subsp. pepo]|uniref:methyl-CpG-binding domain-containing protein 13-like isoform X2 n=1 Tax=Cucurbita pepo subsp. pepo TaxID=3664 RepID=UPI000C9D4A4B|nr:methyl-CpG-binding domain-containing protein 13-like isoform X2 [Cucurbita pepo subsp. pepo]